MPILEFLTMAHRFFVPGEQRAEKVKQLFTTVAPRYDLINDLQGFGLHRYWKRLVIQLARVQQGDRVPDVCCGTGDLALALARRGAQTIGLDFNEEMLRIAESKVPRAEGGSQEPGVRSQESGVRSQKTEARRERAALIEFIRGDAEALRFADNSFDIVTVGYGLRNLTSWEIGLREMQRVAKPGGRLLALEFGKPDNPLWRALYFSYLRLFVPLLGRVFCGNAGAYAYILESLKHYPGQEGVAGKMRELGLIDVRVINLHGGVMSINFAAKP